jgi:hypothetical protein
MLKKRNLLVFFNDDLGMKKINILFSFIHLKLQIVIDRNLLLNRNRNRKLKHTETETETVVVRTALNL